MAPLDHLPSVPCEVMKKFDSEYLRWMSLTLCYLFLKKLVSPRPVFFFLTQGLYLEVWHPSPVGSGLSGSLLQTPRADPQVSASAPAQV